MLLFVVVSLVIVIPTIILHYSQHFTLNSSCKRPSRPSKIHLNDVLPITVNKTCESKRLSEFLQSSNHEAKYGCCCFCSLVTVDEDFNFFPIAFLYYTIYLLLICIVIVVYEFINYNETHNSFSIDLVYQFSIKSYHKHSIFELHEMKRSNTDSLSIYICDFIMIYGFLILQQWHSLFSFWRYYTTFVSTTQFEITTTRSVLLKFSVFTITFSILFIAEIHIYYYLFPITLMIYFSFNWYCTWKFASMLIKQYGVFIAMENKHIIRSNIDNKNILQSVYFMRRTSLICTILNSLSLTIFLITYNIESVYYLPIFWTISCAVNAFNFIRNRNFITNKLQKCCCNLKLNKTDVKPKHKNKNKKNTYGQEFIFSMQSVTDLSINQNSQTRTDIITPQLTNTDSSSKPLMISKQKKIFSSSCSNLKVRSSHNNTGSNLKVNLNANVYSDKNAEESIRGIHNRSAPSLLKYRESLESTSKSDVQLKQITDSSNNEFRIGVHITDSNTSSGLPNIFRHRSTSLLTNVDDINLKDIDIEKALKSFNVLYKYGFLGKSVSNSMLLCRDSY